MVVVGNRGGKEQIVAALLYIFPVGIAVIVSESDREKRRKKKEKRGKKDDSFVSIVSSRAFNTFYPPFFSSPDV